jgi:hypothetical protein
VKFKNRNFDFLFSATSVLILLSLFKFLFHFVINANGAYGFFRDEFYYIACSNHLAWGYVDQPPLSILLLKISRSILGDSLVAIRFLPAVIGASTVFLTGKIAKELGGGIFSQAAAAVCMIIGPIYLSFNNYYSMNSFDVFFWALSFYLLIKILNSGKKNLWYLLGFVLGMALMNKVSILWFGAGLFVGLLLTKNRSLLKTKEPWIAFGIATLIFIPHIIWQIANSFPTLEFMRNAIQDKYVLHSPVEFLHSVILTENPITFPVWLAGLYFLLFNKEGKRYIILAVIFLTVLAILLLNPASKSEYLASSFPILFAGGNIAVEKFLEKKKIFWPKSVVFFVLAAFIFIAPLAVPMLPVKSYIKYARALGEKPSTTEKKKLNELPQFFADMFGWETMASTVARAYNSLSQEEKESCVIFCNNYGEAGAINFLGKQYNLAPAISGHNNYFLWGPVRKQANIVIVIGQKKVELENTFEEVVAADTIRTKYSMPYETDLPIWICKKPKVSLSKIWPQTKHYN